MNPCGFLAKESHASRTTSFIRIARAELIAAATAAAVLNGTGVASASPAPAGHVKGLDVGVPGEAQSGFVVAPDGTRIWSVSLTSTALTST